jgi:hypothetical protein
VAAALAVAASAVGFACGRVIRAGPPPRGAGVAPVERERGLLARLSSRSALDRSAPARAGANSYGGALYGGARYGGEPVDPEAARQTGGSIYANYQFQAPPLPTLSAPAPYQPDYTPMTIAVSGSVEGVVVWPRPPAAAKQLPAAAAGKRCGEVENRTLSLGPGRVVAGAVVWLENIRRGRAIAGRVAPHHAPSRNYQLGGALEWRACQLHPPVQLIAPLGAILHATSADQPVTLTGARVLGAQRVPLFTLGLGAPGAEAEVQLEQSGVHEIATDGAPAGRAWIVVAGHPYHAVTDDAGRFALDQVPPGTYTMVVWHPPVVLRADPDGQPIVTPATQVRRQVRVKARQIERLTVKLPSAR